MNLIAALILVACGGYYDLEPGKAWMLLLADNDGGYWLDPATGKAVRDPKLRTRRVKATKDDGRSQRVPPPPGSIIRLRDLSVTTAKGVTVRMLKNRLRLETKEKKTWLTKVGEGHRPVLRPDGKVLAYFKWSENTWSGKSRRANLVLRDLKTGKEKILVNHTHLSEAAWSPDGTRIAVSTHSDLAIYDVASGKRVFHKLTKDVDERLYAHAPDGLVWSPSGTRLAMRISFLGGRSAKADGSFDDVFGDNQLFLLDLGTKKFRVLKLPKHTHEGPIRGELRTIENK